MHAPAIDSARLSLRGHTTQDFIDRAAMWGDEAVARYIGGRPSTLEEVWSRLLRYAGHWTLLGFGYWAVRETATGRFVGEVGLSDFHRPLDLPFDGLPEAGWALAPWAQGKGYATEAVTAALDWGADHFGSPRAWCLISPENAPSIRVAERVGFREHARATYHDAPTIIFQR